MDRHAEPTATAGWPLRFKRKSRFLGRAWLLPGREAAGLAGKQTLMVLTMDIHRIFGLLLIDFFTGSPFEVELEKDLSLQQQYLDVIIIRKTSGEFVGQLPDGLNDLTDHNLVTFKSRHEPLDDWSLKELTGHYVAYRKLLSSGDTPLLPETRFRLYAVCSRFPHNLAQSAPLEQHSEGVYDCRRGTDVIRIIVAAQLPESEQNALLLLFSAAQRQHNFGATHYGKRASKASSIIRDLFEMEGFPMPYTMEDYERDLLKRRIAQASPEELKEALRELSPEQRLAGLSPEEIEAALIKLKTHPPKTSSKKRKGK